MKNFLYFIYLQDEVAATRKILQGNCSD